MDSTKKSGIQSILDEDSSSKTTTTNIASSSKRKQSDQQTKDRDRKRKKRINSSEISGGEFSDGANEISDDSDFQNNSCTDSDDDEEMNELNYDSNQSDDFNPFVGDDSDSDTDPWVARNKKSKPIKKASTKKKPQSTQDKIQALITKKQTANASATPSSSSTGIIQNSATSTNGFQINYGPPPKDAIERACEMKEELLKKIEKLGDRLPPNTLDQLIDELGGPENVAVKIKFHST